MLLCNQAHACVSICFVRVYMSVAARLLLSRLLSRSILFQLCSVHVLGFVDVFSARKQAQGDWQDEVEEASEAPIRPAGAPSSGKKNSININFLARISCGHS